MLTAEQLLDDVCDPDPVKVAAALQAAHGRGAELTPGLVARLTDVLERPQEWTGDRSPVFLIFLAAEFRETRAHEPITGLLRLPDDLSHRLLCDTITTRAPTILADTFGGDPGPLQALVEDAAAGPFERGAGLYAVAILVSRGRWDRAAVLDWLKTLAAQLDPNADIEVSFANAIVDTALALEAWELREFVLGLYERGLADPMYVEPEYVQEQLVAEGKKDPPPDWLSRTITDAWEEVSHWAYFDPEQAKDRWAAPYDDSLPPPLDLDPVSKAEDLPVEPPKPYIAPFKPGRNDPCPCGSGKKFKKCCGK